MILTAIYRHPIKAHGREQLASVLLSKGECLPFDRHWAVAHEAARLRDGWSPCANFSRGAKAPQLMAITSRLDEATRTITLSHPALPDLSFRPDDDPPEFLDWVRPLMPENRAASARIVSAGRGMTDSEFPSVSILSMSSLADLSTRMGTDLSVHRWRGNLWLDDLPPFAEFDMIGQTLTIGDATLRIEERITRCRATMADPETVGDATLRIEERITRCRATMADPETGEITADTLAGLSSHYGHKDFGVYATVLSGGTITTGDRVK